MPENKKPVSHDPLEEALRRAGEAVQKTSRRGEADGSAPGAQVKPREFGSIELDEEGGDSLDLASESSEPPARPKPAPARSEPAPAGPKPAPARSEPAPARPKPAPARSEPAPARPKPAPAKPEPPAASKESRAQPPPGAATVQPERRVRRRPPEESLPRRPLSRGAKVAIAALVVLIVFALGVFAFLRWQTSERIAEQAELQAMDQGSLDALKNQAARKVDRL